MLNWRFPLGRLAQVVVYSLALLTQGFSEKEIAHQDFTKESVVIEQSKSRAIFQDDGSYVNEQIVKARIQSEAGVRQYGVLSFPYEASNGNVEISDVRVVKPNGSIVVTPLESIQDQTSEISRLAPTYTDMREKHVPVRGLEPGDRLEYSLRYIMNKPLISGQFWIGAYFIKNLVVLDEQVEIDVPREREIKVKSETIPPTIRDDDGRRVYQWNRSNNVSISYQSQSEAQRYDTMRGLLPQPDVLVSSFRTWDEIGRWYDGLQQEKIQPSLEIVTKAQELTKGLSDNEAQIRAIYNYVSLHYRYISIGFGVGRYQPHAATEILASQYGDCKDKHTLLAALLSAVGIHAFPALINSRMAVDMDVPSPGQFDHVISVVPNGKFFYWMDTAPEVTAMGYLMPPLRGKSALVVMPDKIRFETTPTDPPRPNKDVITIAAKLDPDGVLRAHSEATFSGDNESYFRSVFRRLPQSQWTDYGQHTFYGARLGGAVTNVQVSPPENLDRPFTLTYDYTVRNFFGDEMQRRFAVPLPPAGIPEAKNEALPPTSPLFLGYVGEALFECQIELPKEWKASRPNPLDLNESFAEFHGSYEMHDNVFVTRRKLILKTSAIFPNQWEKYKAFQTAISNNQALFIFLSTPPTTPH